MLLPFGACTLFHTVSPLLSNCSVSISIIVPLYLQGKKKIHQQLRTFEEGSNTVQFMRYSYVNLTISQFFSVKGQIEAF
jgi:hypothetical protein